MADIETELGISANYFVMLRSTSYNLFCVESCRIIEKLLKGEHSIGLHFMSELCEKDGIQSMVEKILAEVNLIEQEFGMSVSAMSFHQPSEGILRENIFIGTLINTYNRIQMKDYCYISDSNMTWKHENPGEIFTRRIYSRLQLLIHPMWWTNESMSLKEKWLDVLKTNTNVVTKHWEQRERTLRNTSLI